MPSAVLGATDTGDPRQTCLSSGTPIELVSYYPEYVGMGVGGEPGSYGRQRRYLDSQEGFLEEEVIVVVLIK